MGTLQTIIVEGEKLQLTGLDMEDIHRPYHPHQHLSHPNIQDQTGIILTILVGTDSN